MATKRRAHARDEDGNGRFTGSVPPRTIWIMPGLTLMHVEELGAGNVVVRCPGCGAVRVYSTAHMPKAFSHDDDDCPILKRIEAALALLRTETGVDLMELFRTKA